MKSWFRHRLILAAGLGAILHAVSAHAAPSGYIRSWLISGPFENADVEKPVVQGESAVRPKAGDLWRGKEWKLHSSVEDMIDLSNPLVMEYKTNAAAYAFVRIHSPEDQPALLRMGSDDSLRLWLNGEEVLSNPVPRPYKEGDEKLMVHLNKGWNDLLVKVGNYYGSWGYGCGVFGLDGTPLKGLKFDPYVPGMERLVPKKVIVTSQEGRDPTFRPMHLVDGNRGTRWASAQGGVPQAITMDFGAPQEFSRLSIFWEGAYASSYCVDFSQDGKSWKTAHADDKFEGGQSFVTFPKGLPAARYMRIRCLKRGTPWGYSIWEIIPVGKASGPRASELAEEVATEAGPPPVRVVSVRASSNEAGHSPSMAVDGVLETYWGSRHKHDPEWIELDLGGTREFSQIVLSWEGAYAKKHVVEISSDQKAWTPVHRTEAGRGDVEEISLGKSVRARYVRITGLARGTEWGYALREVKFF